MMLAEHSYPRNMMVQNSQLPFFHIYFWKHKENGAPQNRKLIEFTTQSPKWNYYLQRAGFIVWNDHKPLYRFLNGKNANNKVNRWGWELGTYSITIKWISGACNKAADCLSCLVDPPQDKPVVVNMLSATNSDGPAFNTRSQTCQHFSPDTPTSQPDVMSHQKLQKLQILHQNP